jgi:hypothetical protein
MKPFSTSSRQIFTTKQIYVAKQGPGSQIKILLTSKKIDSRLCLKTRSGGNGVEKVTKIVVVYLDLVKLG